MTGRRSHGRLSALNGVVHQGTESVVACNVLNQMTELGRPESYSIGR